MDIKKSNKITTITNSIKTIVFVLICCILFLRITYLFRNSSFERTHIIGFKEEKCPIDVLYIGGSAAHRYYQPLKAWVDCGYTSWLYTNSNLQAEGIKYYILE